MRERIIHCINETEVRHHLPSAKMIDHGPASADGIDWNLDQIPIIVRVHQENFFDTMTIKENNWLTPHRASDGFERQTWHEAPIYISHEIDPTDDSIIVWIVVEKPMITSRHVDHGNVRRNAKGVDQWISRKVFAFRQDHILDGRGLHRFKPLERSRPSRLGRGRTWVIKVPEDHIAKGFKPPGKALITGTGLATGGLNPLDLGGTNAAAALWQNILKKGPLRFAPGDIHADPGNSGGLQVLKSLFVNTTGEGPTPNGADRLLINREDSDFGLGF